MDNTVPVYKEIAERLRGLRDAVGITVEEMAEKLDVKKSVVTEFESGNVDIPVSHLFSIAKIFSIDPSVLMSGNESHLHNFSFVKKENTMGVERRKDYDYHSLAYRFAGRRMEPFKVTVPSKSEQEMTFNEHPGQEFIHLMEGRLEVVLGTEKIIMAVGDSLYFDSRIPHAMRGLDNKPATFIDVLA